MFALALLFNLSLAFQSALIDLTPKTSIKNTPYDLGGLGSLLHQSQSVRGSKVWECEGLGSRQSKNETKRRRRTWEAGRKGEGGKENRERNKKQGKG